MFTPKNLPNLSLWLAADTAVVENGGAVSQWSDLSGNSYHATQNTPNQRPLRVDSVLNNKPALRFDGTNDFLNVPEINNIHNSSLSIFIVASGLSMPSYPSIFDVGINFSTGFMILKSSNGRFDVYNNGSNIMAANQMPNTGFSPKIFGVQKSLGNFLRSYVNGTQVASGTSTNLTSAFINGPFKIANSNFNTSLFWKGDIFEIIIYNTILHDTNRTKIENYLWFKYFVEPVNLGSDILHDYKFCDTITLDATGNFTSYLWNTGASTPTITVTQGGTYSVTATDAYGFTSTDAINIYFPQVYIPDTLICYGDTLHLHAHNAIFKPGPLSVAEGNLVDDPHNYTFLWSNGDNTPETSITQTGKCWLQVTDSLGCHRTDTFYVAVDSMAYHASLPPDTVQLCAGNILQMQSGQAYVSNYFWSPSGQTTPSIVINTSDRYYVTLTSPNNCIKTDSVYVKIIGTAPIPNFSITGFCTGDTIYFQDLSTGPDPINYRQWIIGTDTFTTQNSLLTTHYSFAGTYNLKLTVGTPTECYSDTTATFEIKQGLTAGFFNDPLCIGTQALFTDTTLIPSGETLASRHWFANGTPIGTDSLLTFSPLTTDSLLLTLKLTLTNGCTDSLSKLLPLAQSFPSPMPFNLISPPHEHIVPAGNIEFVWNNTPNALKYKLIITSDSLFTDTIYHSNFIYPTAPNSLLITHYSSLTTHHSLLYWKVLAFNPCHNTTSSPVRKLNILSASFSSNMKLWLSADSVQIIDNKVATWYDKSLYGFNATQSTAANRPQKINNVLNSHPAIRFNGSNNFLNFPLIQGIDSSSITLFVVVSGLNQSFKGFFQINTYPIGFYCGKSGNGSSLINNNNVGTTANNDNLMPNTGFSPLIFRAEKKINNYLSSFINNTQVFNTTQANGTSPFTNAAGKIGVIENNQYWNGDIFELILFDTVLSNDKKNFIQQYLSTKYAPQLNLGSDIYIPYGFCDTVIRAPQGFSNLLWSTGATADSIIVNKSGKYWLTATNSLGISSTDTIEVFYPYLSFADTSICYGDTILSRWLSVAPNGWLSPVETTLQTPNLYEFEWSTGATTPEIQISQAGLYWLKVTDNQGCHRTDTFLVAVDSMAYHAQLSADTLQLCAGNILQLQSGQSYVSDYLWHPSGQNTPTIVIDTSARYHVTLTSPNNCIKTDSVYVKVIGTAPVPNFSITGFCTGDTIYFQDLSTGPDPINYRQWIIGTDTFTTQNSLLTTHYSFAGTYNLKLTVGTTTECYSDTTATFTIKQGLSTGFFNDPLCLGTQALFTDTTPIPLGETLASRQWFANGTQIGTDSLLTFSPLTTDSLLLTLKLTLTNGCTDSLSKLLPLAQSFPSPMPFNLISPPHNHVTIPGNIAFSWNNTPNALKYKLYISSNAAFTDTIYHSDFIYPTAPNSLLITHYSSLTTHHSLLYWKVLAFNPCNTPTSSPVRKLNILSASFSSNMKLWLSADSVQIIDNKVATWFDKSLYGFNATQTNAANRPLKINNVLNSHPAIRFNGSNNFLNLPLIQDIDSSSITLFVVVSGLNQGFKGFFQINTYPIGFYCGKSGNGSSLISNNNVGTTANNDNLMPNSGFSPLIFRAEKKINNYLRSFVNETQVFNTTAQNGTSPFTNAAGKVGVIENIQYWNGDIFELILFDTVLSNDKKNFIQQYLSTKYAPQLNLGSDIYIPYGFCDTVIRAPQGFSNLLWSTGATTDSIIVNKSGKYWLTATNSLGISSTDTIEVFYPYLSFADTLICYGDTILSRWLSVAPNGWLSPVETTLQTPNLYEFEWSTGATTPEIQISQAGLYWLKVTDNQGCHRTDTFLVAVDSMAYFLNLGSDVSLCKGNKIFVNQGQSYITDYLWQPTGETTPHTTINQPGWYVLQASNHNCIAYDSLFAPATDTVPHINFSITGFCTNDSIHFTDLSTHPTDINDWQWIIGTDTFTTHYSLLTTHYSLPGTYNLQLAVTSTSGCHNDTAATFNILPAPLAQFSHFPPCIGIETIFIDNTDIPLSTTLYERQWLINGTQAGSDSLLTFSPLTTDSLLLTLKLTLNNTCADSTSKLIPVAQNYPPPQNFTLIYPTHNIVLADSTITFQWNHAQNAVKYKITIATDSLFTNIIDQSNFIYPGSGTEPVEVHIAITTHHSLLYWQVTAYNPCNTPINSSYRKFHLFNPNQIANLQLWLAADSGVIDSLGSVSLWLDLSNNSNNATQFTHSNKPIKNESFLGNKKSISFNGINNFLTFPQISGVNNSSIALFIIASGNSMSNYPDLFRINQHPNGFNFGKSSNGSTALCNNTIFTPSSHNNLMPNSGFMPKIFSNIKSINNHLTTYVNGNQIWYSNALMGTAPFINNIGYIGVNYLNHYWNGDIAEIIFYDTLLTNNERELVEKYLMDKYAPPVCLGPDLHMMAMLCDTALHAGNGYAAYLWSTGDSTASITVNSAGTYWVQVEDIFGRISSDTVKVHMPVFTVGDTTICYGDMVHMSTGYGDEFMYHWSTGQTTPSIDLYNSGNYTLTISDYYGCHKVIAFSLTIDNFVNTATLGNDTTICNGASIGLVVGAQETIIYNWSTGANTPQIIPLNDGPYTLEAINFRGCYAYDTIHVTLHGHLPVPNFTYVSACQGSPIHFTNTTQAHPSDPWGYGFWEFIGGIPTSNTQFNPSINPFSTFLNQGEHQVRLTVRTGTGCEAVIIKDVSVYDKPLVNFMPTNGCKDEPVPFIDNSTVAYGQAEQWLWSFGDGQQDTAQNPLHAYTDEGTYTVKLITTTSFGCTDSLQKIINIKLGPEVDFEYTDVCFGQEVQFTDKTITYAWTEIYERLWNFGDGNASALVNPKHTFIDSAGLYDVSLLVKSVNGCNITHTKTIKVNDIPTADFITGTACANTPYQIFDISTVENDTIAAWHWEFGSFATATDKDPWVTFPLPGSYDVFLQVTTAANCANYITLPVEVLPSPKAEFALTPRYGIAPLSVQFTNFSIDASSYTWNFGDNTPASAQTHPVHTYMQNGIYTVELTAINNLGCYNLYTDEVNVIPTIVDIAVTDVSIDINNNFLGLKAILQNLGTRPLYKLELTAQASNGMVFRELWEGEIVPGENIEYPFTAQFLIGDDDINYVCVKAQTLEIENDVNPANNEKCKAVTNDFMLLTPFPNPAGTSVSFDIIIPYQDKVLIKLYNMLGQTITTIHDGELPQGITRFTLNLEGLRKGVFAIEATFRDEKTITKFVKY